MSEGALARIYQLFAVTELSQSHRLELLREAFFARAPLHDPASAFESQKIQLSLAKDAISLSVSTSSAMADAAQRLLERLNLTRVRLIFCANGSTGDSDH
jgi:hypothetical protein